MENRLIQEKGSQYLSSRCMFAFTVISRFHEHVHNYLNCAFLSTKLKIQPRITSETPTRILIGYSIKLRWFSLTLAEIIAVDLIDSSTDVTCQIKMRSGNFKPVVLFLKIELWKAIGLNSIDRKSRLHPKIQGGSDKTGNVKKVSHPAIQEIREAM